MLCPSLFSAHVYSTSNNRILLDSRRCTRADLKRLAVQDSSGESPQIDHQYVLQQFRSLTTRKETRDNSQSSPDDGDGWLTPPNVKKQRGASKSVGKSSQTPRHSSLKKDGGASTRKAPSSSSSHSSLSINDPSTGRIKRQSQGKSQRIKSTLSENTSSRHGVAVAAGGKALHAVSAPVQFGPGRGFGPVEVPVYGPDVVKIFRFAAEEKRLFKAAAEADLLSRVVCVSRIEDADVVLAVKATPSGKHVNLAQGERAAQNAGLPFVVVGRSLTKENLVMALSPYLKQQQSGRVSQQEVEPSVSPPVS